MFTQPSINKTKICKRQGKDLLIAWTITTNEQNTSLVGRDLTLIRKSKFDKREVEFAAASNVVSFTFRGTEQKYCTEYQFELWENKGKHGQTLVDASVILCLVPDTSLEGGTADNIQVESVDLGTSNIQAGVKGADGVGVASVTSVQTSTESKGKNIVRVTLTNGTYTDFTFYNGQDADVAAATQATQAANAAAGSASTAASSARAAAQLASSAANSANNAANAAQSAKEAANTAATAANTAALNANKAADKVKDVTSDNVTMVNLKRSVSVGTIESQSVTKSIGTLATGDRIEASTTGAECSVILVNGNGNTISSQLPYIVTAAHNGESASIVYTKSSATAEVVGSDIRIYETKGLLTESINEKATIVPLTFSSADDNKIKVIDYIPIEGSGIHIGSAGLPYVFVSAYPLLMISHWRCGYATINNTFSGVLIFCTHLNDGDSLSNEGFTYHVYVADGGYFKYHAQYTQPNIPNELKAVMGELNSGGGANAINILDYTDTTDVMPLGSLYCLKDGNFVYPLQHIRIVYNSSEDKVYFLVCAQHGDYKEYFQFASHSKSLGGGEYEQDGWVYENIYEPDDDIPAWILREFGENLASSTIDGLMSKEDKAKLDGIDVSNLASTTQLGSKVDKVEGKGLSTNDYTNSDKSKVAQVDDLVTQVGEFTDSRTKSVAKSIEELESEKADKSALADYPKNIYQEDIYIEIDSNDGITLESRSSDLPALVTIGSDGGQGNAAIFAFSTGNIELEAEADLLLLGRKLTFNDKDVATEEYVDNKWQISDSKCGALNDLTTTEKSSLVKAINEVNAKPSGGGEPSEYIKSASVSGNTLTLTKKDGTTQDYTPSTPTWADIKPSDGVALTDLASSVQTSISRADEIYNDYVTAQNLI